MRDIKFRVWDDNPDYKGYLIDDMTFLRADGDCLLDDFGDVFPMNDLTIEQYTGMADKNGVEIYEGDIIDTHWGNEENRLVKYDNEMGFYLTPDQDQSYWTMAYRGEYEVIGNIHENAELLEVEKE